VAIAHRTAGALVLGLTLFAVEPIRAAHDPAINEGDPTACVGGPRLDCTLSAETWQRLRATSGARSTAGTTR
jgi:hypothetical protein